MKAAALFRRVKAAVDAGRLGPLIGVHAVLPWYREDSYYQGPHGAWKGTWAMDGGGSLMNQGVHTVDLLQWVGGRVRSVYGAFGGLMALLLWLYLSGAIFIFCACLCAAQAEMRRRLAQCDLLARHPARPARDLFAALRARGIIVRYFDRPRIDDYLRITIGTDAQCDELLSVLAELLG